MSIQFNVDTRQFALHGPSMSYLFHVDDTGDLVHDHFGARALEAFPDPGHTPDKGWNHGAMAGKQREFPDSGRGDFRLPAIHIAHPSTTGHTVSHFVYARHNIVQGKPELAGLPSTFGIEGEVSTLLVTMEDRYSSLVATLSYSVFHTLDAITRSFTITNKGEASVTIERAASFSVDLDAEELELVQLTGQWISEAKVVRRKIDYGTQGFHSAVGYSSHFHNPFVALVSPATTETQGSAYGFSLVYTGSFSVQVEKSPRGHTRVLIGLNPLHLSWPLAPGETFTSPECVATYSVNGLGGMSRIYHRLYRSNLSRSAHTFRARPPLINNWEATYFNMDEDRLYPIARTASQLGVKLFVMDDGWFGDKRPRLRDNAGLGDWVVNPRRFPSGLKHFVDRIKALKVQGGSATMKFGIWVEPEMVNRVSELYESHPDWVLHAGEHERTLQRFQLVLNLGLVPVQDYIIDTIGAILASADISYVKWDNNRSMHELPHSSANHKYMLGLYRVIDTLTKRFPDVLWEGCASGGGRFDPGLLHYWPQHWTSDNTDAFDRLFIQFGTSLAYPPSAMGCHVAAVPSHQTRRVTPFEFRAHVAMMGGSFGFELDLNTLSEAEKSSIPDLIKLSERINPFVINGDMYRLAVPWESNWPAVQYTAESEAEVVVLAYQMLDARAHEKAPPLRLQGLALDATYDVDGVHYGGAQLVHVGLPALWKGDYQSKVIWVTKVANV